MMNLPDLHDELLKRRTVGLFDDFHHFVDTDVWTKLAADGGSSVANSDNVAGLVTLTTGGTDNNEAALAGTRKNWLIAANKPIVFEARINYAEGNTNKANVAAGIASVIGAANFLQDDGAGPAASFSGCAIYKVDGGTVWKCVSSLGATQTISTSTATAGGTADQVLRIEIRPVTSTLAEVSFFVDGQPLYDAAITSKNQPIKHQLTYTSAVKMQPGVYVKAGSATSEVVNVDYVGVEMLR